MQMFAKKLKKFKHHIVVDAKASQRIKNFKKLKKQMLMLSQIFQKAFSRALG